MKKRLEGLLQHAITEATKGGALKSSSLPPLVLEVPKDPNFGDIATPVALGLARAERRSPRDIAETIVAHLHDPEGWVSSTEIAGPGYINLRLSPAFWSTCLAEVDHADFGKVSLGSEPVLVEYVSGNPTGPLHVGHGRGAVTGDVVARLLAAAGFDVTREYYINDAGRQIATLGRSVVARLRQICGDDVPFPEDGYPGEYLIEVVTRERDALLGKLAASVSESPPRTDDESRRLLAAHAERAAPICAEHVSAVMMRMIEDDLRLCDIRFDNFVSERTLIESGAITSAIEDLQQRGLLYEKDGARWFRSEQFGDEKDRVVVRSNGELTYFAGDIGYHRDKLQRGYARLINIWGADHHGYIDRVKAAIQALGRPQETLQVLLVQIVNLTRSGVPVRMGKRKGEFVSLREIVEEVGADAARFFFLMRKSDSQLDFDLDLAKKQGADNPVFYVQYAHARCCSIFRQAAAAGVAVPPAAETDFNLLTTAEENELVKQLAAFPDVIAESTAQLEPHRVVFYLIDLAGCFHRFYNRHRVLGEDAALSRTRLYLVKAVQTVARQGLQLVGVRAPESM